MLVKGRWIGSWMIEYMDSWMNEFIISSQKFYYCATAVPVEVSTGTLEHFLLS
jgi:hypothetical protein